MSKQLPIVDEFIIAEDGTITGWACAFNDLALPGSEREPLRECAAPRHECPRGFTIAFECKKHGSLP